MSDHITDITQLYARYSHSIDPRDLDRLVRTKAGWRFAARRITFTWRA
ncbi:hypothetical protein [Actinomadura sp. KC345]|nr:hypothetical protein [Actinomadura sp. KC345]